MRLTPDQTHAIVSATRALAGNDARVWLFGSRVRDDARGGDVDLLLDMDCAVQEPCFIVSQPGRTGFPIHVWSQS